jgi:hypothetical protein
MNISFLFECRSLCPKVMVAHKHWSKYVEIQNIENLDFTVGYVHEEEV